jgi:hypothetical protein
VSRHADLPARPSRRSRNQNWRTSVGTPPRPAALSLLSVAYDEPRSENEGRYRVKRVIRFD